VQELCGDRFAEHLREEGRGVSVAGCDGYSDGRLGASVGRHDDGRLAFVNVFVIGDLPAMPGLYSRMMSAVAPLIERDRRATIQEQLETLVPRLHGRGLEAPREALYSGVGTTVGEVPWRREAQASLTFDGTDDLEKQTRTWAEWLASVREIGWASDLGEVSSQTIAAWQSLCVDDLAIAALVGDGLEVSPQVLRWPGRWSVGETWMRCHVVFRTRYDDKIDLDFWTQWMGPTRRLLRVQIELKGVRGDSFPALAERIVIPLIRNSSSPPNVVLQAQVRQAATAGEFRTKDSPVHSSHTPPYILPPNTSYQLDVCRADCI
jgi:hypothetical protein